VDIGEIRADIRARPELRRSQFRQATGPAGPVLPRMAPGRTRPSRCCP
jgi:hypothetical protein